ncbi:MAG: GtrA family protein [Prevotella sp.]|jgi:putative flippase GtrA|nr:GtrA family protein [Prevotella sp.]
MKIDSSPVPISKLIKEFRTLILYGIIGSASAALDFLLYTFFVNVLSWHYIVSNCISVLAGISTSFSLNRTYNFKVKDQITKRFSIFLCVGLCGMLFSNLILYLCIDYLQMNKIFSKLLSIVLVVFFQFLVNKYITFKPTKKSNE